MKVYLKANVIQKKLFRKNKSQNWLAEQFDISSGYMSQLMDGSRNPRQYSGSKFLKFFAGMILTSCLLLKKRNNHE